MHSIALQIDPPVSVIGIPYLARQENVSEWHLTVYLILWIQSSVVDPSVGFRLTLEPEPQTENESEFRSKLNFDIGMLVRDIYSFASFFLHKIKHVSNKNKCRSRDF